jgi:hypothetical protein
MFKTGIKRINLRTNENLSMIGLQKIRKLLRLSFFLLVQSKVLKITLINSLKISRDLTGYGNNKSKLSLSYSTAKTLNLKILRVNLKISALSMMKLH